MLMTAEFWVAVAFVMFGMVVVYAGAHKAVPSSLDGRASRIKAELEEASRLKQEAAALLAEYKQKTANADKEAAAIIEGAKADAERLAAEAHSKLEDFVVRRTKMAEAKIAQAETAGACRRAQHRRRCRGRCRREGYGPGRQRRAGRAADRARHRRRQEEAELKAVSVAALILRTCKSSNGRRWARPINSCAKKPGRSWVRTPKSCTTAILPSDPTRSEEHVGDVPRGHPVMIIFDCNGVLVDSETIATRVAAEAFQRVGINMTPDMVARYFTGRRPADMVADVEKAAGVQLPPKFASVLLAATLVKLSQEVRGIPHVAHALSWLRGPKCVASSSGLDRVRVSLDATELTRFFGGNLFSANDVAEGKPAPDLFLHVARQTGIAAAGLLRCRGLAGRRECGGGCGDDGSRLCRRQPYRRGFGRQACRCRSHNGDRRHARTQGRRHAIARILTRSSRVALERVVTRRAAPAAFSLPVAAPAPSRAGRSRHK